MIEQRWEAIVVGAGSSGCVVAARLSDHPNRRVLLLEAGPDYRADHAPEAMRRGHWTGIMDRGCFPQFQWPALQARRRPEREPEPLWRGRGVGGSSAINGQVALRPPLTEFDEWAATGATEWNAEMALAGYIAIERDLEFGDRAYHGKAGPIPISRARRRDWSALDRAFYQAFRNEGLPDTTDSNAPGASGLSALPYNALGELRVAANEGYLEPIRHRSNLRIVGDALVDRVLFEGARAVGVKVTIAGEELTLRSDLVVLSAGAIHSPAILMRSGIGPVANLQNHNIEVRADLPVGKAYQEHPHIFFGFDIEAADGVALNSRHTNLCARWSSHIPDTGQNDIAAIVNGPGPDAPTAAGVGFTLNQAFSRGSVTLAAANPNIDPHVDMNLVDDPRDRQRLKAAFTTFSRMVTDPSLQQMIRTPIRDCNGQSLPSEQDLDSWIYAVVDGSAHSSGTCPLDAPERSVLVGCARVIGTEHLHVIDLSITPSSPRANPNLTAFMIGEHFGRRLATIY